MTTITTDPLTAWARTEQVALWTDLELAIRNAANGVWSMSASNYAARIAAAARLIGPSPIGEVPWQLSAGGIYHALLDIAGVPSIKPTEEDWEKAEALMVPAGHLPRVQALARMAGTRRAMAASREARWIRDQEDGP